MVKADAMKELAEKIVVEILRLNVDKNIFFMKKPKKAVAAVDSKDLYFKQVPVGYMGNFIYLIGDRKAKECVMVDPAWDVDAVLKDVEKDGMKVVAGILTHTHFDHANGVEALVKKTGCKIYVHENEAKYVKEIEGHLVKTKEGSKLKIGDVEMVFLHTPGHTEGAQCILVEDKLVTGDTLFRWTTKYPYRNSNFIAGPLKSKLAFCVVTVRWWFELGIGH